MAVEALRDITRAGTSAFLGGGSASIEAVSVNLGWPAKRAGRATLTHASIQATDKLMVTMAPGPYTSKGTRADEAELMGPISFPAVPSNGSAQLYWSSPFVQGGNVTVHFLRG